jgi:hypothetical protein
MQVTIELPDPLARRLAPGGNHRTRREVATFLARGPSPEEIAAFRRSESFIERSRELLDRNREGLLSPEEQAELEEIASLDDLMMLVKAEARKALAAAS